ncbi:DNA polymerase III subunit chi [Chitinibacter tainanensis]|uniref:DNA polymerase III subunit chi n=1 Tax=Chitinibacter tainanensis TaxID=230667 RepID=UPI0004195DDD|nr:DNA polymerase III subunit chi [Chitinibacter tainanensis]
MTVISFYFNVSSRESALCQLAGKAIAAGKSVWILTGSPAASAALDRLLWEVPATGFLPHCAADDAMVGLTPIVIDHRVELLHDRDVLFNWTDHVVTQLERCARLIEIVDTDEDLKLAARRRWTAYKQLGYAPQGTDMQELYRARAESAG